MSNPGGGGRGSEDFAKARPEDGAASLKASNSWESEGAVPDPLVLDAFEPDFMLQSWWKH